MSIKKLIAIFMALAFLGVAGLAGVFLYVSTNLPKMITLADYEPLLVTQVYDRNNKKIGEFFREKRILVPYNEIPPILVKAFVAAEDDTFFQHGGINYLATFRAFLENLKAGRKKQGGSTITQQVARSLLLSSEKTYIRKIKEIILASRMESHLSKEDILYLYLNQIYLGQGAYGVGAAADIYFQKSVKDLTLPEAAMLAGLPQAPSRYSPIYNPHAAKERQRYVLKRMEEVGFIAAEEGKAAVLKPLEISVRKNYKELAPYYLETIRQILVKKLGEETVLDKGLKVYTGLDLDKQIAAQESLRKGLRELDKRQGFRGAAKNLQKPEEIANFLKETRDALIDDKTPVRTIRPDGTIEGKGELNLSGKDANGQKLKTIPDYVTLGEIVDGIVTKVDDSHGLVYVRFVESKGLIDLETMKWARKPDPNVIAASAEIRKPSEALKKGDVIQVKVARRTFTSERIEKDLGNLRKKLKKKYKRPDDLPDFSEYAGLELEQTPQVEAALLSIDQNTMDLLSMVGGYDFERSEFNRTIQAARQTGSSFKSIVYAAALDKGYTPATPIVDAPVVFEEDQELKEGQDSEEATKKWKPTNIGKKFSGDILFRNALVKSLNVPTVKVIESVGVDWVANYARRLGVFSPLNMDFTLALGSSGVTLYEMTKVFSEIGRLGRRTKPILVHKVVDQKEKTLLESLSLDERFEVEIAKNEEEFEKRRLNFLEWKKTHPNGALPTDSPVAKGERDPAKEPPLFFDDPDQLMKPNTAFVMTTLLQGVVEEKGGSGARARALGRPVAGKTGTTNGYNDAWFVGFTPDVATGVWVGFDEEKSLGRGEVGSHAALPIWLEFMKSAHENLPIRNFPVPEGVVFASIDNETGRLASPSSKEVVKQAFIEGTEPQESGAQSGTAEEQNFYKEDLQE